MWRNLHRIETRNGVHDSNNRRMPRTPRTVISRRGKGASPPLDLLLLRVVQKRTAWSAYPVFIRAEQLFCVREIDMTRSAFVQRPSVRRLVVRWLFPYDIARTFE